MKLPFLTLALVCILAAGCSSIPRADNCNQLYSFTREEKRIKRKFAPKTKIVLINDFRGRQAYDEDIAELKARVEEYISSHADLDEAAKNNLREIKVTAGSTKEQVILLLGQPDKITKAEKEAAGPSE
ncbi:MAG: hypothetical protein PHG40_01420, partial [Candidatus Omnitrophica bacterium]|nr:hypothetical protein [Candidatus Omnitrophota bacterium]